MSPRHVTLLATLFLSATASAATPSQGTINGAPFASTPDGGTNGVTWAGTPRVGVPSPPVSAETVVAQCLGATPLPQCDVFRVTFNAPANYWTQASAAGFTGNIEFHLGGLDAAAQEDIDLYVFDSSNALVCNSGNAAGLDEDCLANRPTPGATYSVVAYYYVNTVPTDAYRGFATLNLVPDTAVNTSVGTDITFFPATWADLQRTGAEPMINVDHQGKGRVYVDWPFSSTLSTSVVTRSTDHGDTFKTLYNPGAANNSTVHLTRAGGGDSEVTLAPVGDTVYASDQEEVANFNITSSPSAGFTWPYETPFSSQTTDVDRMWMAAEHSQDAWIAYHQVGVAANVYWNVTHNGGQTWAPLETLQTAYYAATQTGPLVADLTGANAGALFHAFHNSTSFQVAVTLDGGPSFTTHDVAGDFGGIFPWIAVDSAGNLYAVWTSASGADVMLSTSLASAPANVGHPGTRWSTPVRVSAPPAQTAVMAEVAAGSPGRVAILFYGTDGDGQPDTQPASAQWQTYVAFSEEALCGWSAAAPGLVAPCRANASSPHFLQSAVSLRTPHTADICTSGTTCTGNRNLADMIDIDFDETGRLIATWSDDHNAGNRDFMRVGKQRTGPSLLAGNPPFSDPLPQGRVSDPLGDAYWPTTAVDLATALDAGGSYQPAADLTGFAVTDLDGQLSFHFTIAASGIPDGGGAFDDGGNPFLEAMRAAEGTTTGKRLVYGVRWQSAGDDFFAALELNGSGTVQAFTGPVTPNSGMEQGNYTGALGFNAATKVTDPYPPRPARWSIAGSELVITQDLSAIPQVSDGGQAFVPATAQGRLLSVVGAVMVGDDETTETRVHMKNVYDATAAMIYDLTGATTPDGGSTATSGTSATLGGTIGSTLSSAGSTLGTGTVGSSSGSGSGSTGAGTVGSSSSAAAASTGGSSGVSASASSSASGSSGSAGALGSTGSSSGSSGASSSASSGTSGSSGSASGTLGSTGRASSSASGSVGTTGRASSSGSAGSSGRSISAGASSGGGSVRGGGCGCGATDQSSLLLLSFGALALLRRRRPGARIA